jgi:hypothetical protein
MNYVIMIKLTKLSEDTVEDNMPTNENTFDHRLLSQTQEYRLEASIDILKLYHTLNNLELGGTTSASYGGHNSTSLGSNARYGNSPTIIFPDELQHRPATLSIPDTDGGSVSSYLSPLSNTNISSFVTGVSGEKSDVTQI